MHACELQVWRRAPLCFSPLGSATWSRGLGPEATASRGHPAGVRLTPWDGRAWDTDHPSPPPPVHATNPTR